MLRQHADIRPTCELHTHNLWQSHADSDCDRDGAIANTDSNSNCNGNAYAKPDGNSNSNGNANAKPDGNSDSDTDTWTEDYTVAKAASYAAAASLRRLF
jgi:hypothetical protein